jgi:hypothetical protein
MSKGLGQLQRSILRLTLDYGGMVRTGDLLKVLWGWQTKPGKDQYDGGQVFDRASIGVQEYSRAHSSLSCSLERLRQRGLVQVYKSGYGTAVGLTSAGEKEARGIHWEGEEEPEP